MTRLSLVLGVIALVLVQAAAFAALTEDELRAKDRDFMARGLDYFTASLDEGKEMGAVSHDVASVEVQCTDGAALGVQLAVLAAYATREGHQEAGGPSTPMGAALKGPTALLLSLGMDLAPVGLGRLVQQLEGNEQGRLAPDYIGVACSFATALTLVRDPEDVGWAGALVQAGSTWQEAGMVWTRWESPVSTAPDATTTKQRAKVLDAAREAVDGVRAALEGIRGTLAPELIAKAARALDAAATALAAGLPDGEGGGERVGRVALGHDPQDGTVKVIRGEVVWPVVLEMVADARDVAIRTSCLSNVKQLGLGMTAYCEDYDGRFPPEDGWKKPLLPYLGDSGEDLLKCPDDDSGQALSYFFNAALSRRNVGSLAHPDQLIMFADGRPGSGGPERLIARHDGEVCCVFADGHTQSLALEEARKPEHWGLK